MKLLFSDSLPCLLCGSKLEKRVTKNGKPYFVCDPCGIQLFVRRKAGIARLENLMRIAEKNAIPFTKHAQKLFEVQAILNDIQGTKSQIQKVESEIGIFSPRKTKFVFATHSQYATKSFWNN